MANTRAGLVCAGASEEGVHPVLVRVVLAARGHRRPPGACLPTPLPSVSLGPGTEVPVRLHSVPPPPPRALGTLGRSFTLSRLLVSQWQNGPVPPQAGLEEPKAGLKRMLSQREPLLLASPPPYRSAFRRLVLPSPPLLGHTDGLAFFPLTLTLLFWSLLPPCSPGSVSRLPRDLLKLPPALTFGGEGVCELLLAGLFMDRSQPWSVATAVWSPPVFPSLQH